MRFECLSGCIKCCEQKGFVYLSEDDLARLAAFKGMRKSAFATKYIVRTKHTVRFRKPRDKQCPFLATNGCEVHPAKPTQCSTFPFWPELLDDPKELKAASRYCPGIGRGKLVNITFARKEAEAMRAAVPHQYQ
jgi:Fe-S-cluster containining protein